MFVTQQPEFFGRVQVLRALREHLEVVRSTGRGRMVAVRGRRQVGKSTVVERFVQSAQQPYVFVTGVYQAGVGKQLRDATMAITESTHPLPDAALLTQTPATTWQEWLARLALAAVRGPVVAVLDEFPWLAAAEVSLEGELQAQWDRVLEKLPVLLILVGSDVAMMDRLASYGHPLFGRVSPLVVPALNPAELAAALPDRSPLEVFDAYLVTGGYPRLVADLARYQFSASDYVRRCLGDLYSPLVATARLSLDAEFAQPQAAYQVLSAIGASEVANPGFNDVLGAIADPQQRQRTETAISRSLHTLTQVKGLVQRELPAWAPENSKQRRYRITDPYLRFWFRYVERNVERIARGRADLAVAAFERDWPSWRGMSIEPVVREALTRLAIHDPRLVGVEEVHPWWTRDNRVEVDVVAQSRQASVLIGSIKWRPQGGVTSTDMHHLRLAGQQVPRSATARYAAISPNGASPEGADLAFTAQDLLAAWQTQS